MDTGIFHPGDIELRQEGSRRTLRGKFPYGKRAVVRDRGKVRKEEFATYSLGFAIQDTARPIHLLIGHSFDRPVAVRSAAGALVAAVAALTITDSESGVEFETEIAAEDELPTYLVDLLRMLDLGLVGGISPGFTVPPLGVVPGAEKLVPEPSNPSVQIRMINQAVLHEMSLVTRPAYSETEVDLRAEFSKLHQPARRTARWL